MHSISNRIKNIYFDLFQDDFVYVALGLSLLQEDLRRIKDKETILSFDDWAQFSEIKTYDDEWIEEFQFDLTKRAFQFNLPKCAKVLFEISTYKEQTSKLLSIIKAAVDNNSLDCIDVLVSFFPHPDSDLFVFGGPTLYSHVLYLGNKTIAEYLLKKHNVNPDGLKVVNSEGEYEDYSDVISTREHGSCLVWIMTSPYMTNLEKLDMLSFAISKGASPLGHSQEADCFDSPIQVAASLHVVFLEFFLSLGIDPNQKRHEAIFSAVSSQASFDQKHKILQILLNTCKVDINQVSPKTGCSVIEWCIIQNGTDAMKTIKYLIDRGADHNPDHLLSLAHDYEYYELREEIYSQLHCSEKLYKDLVQQEKEKKQNKKNDDTTKIHLFFPQKEY
jgi:hypothetical protein